MASSMSFDITAQDSASREFLTIAAAADKLQEKLKKLDGQKYEPKVDLNIDPANRKLDQLNTRLKALQNVRAKVDVDGADVARKQVSDLVVELRKIRDTNAKINLGTAEARKDVQQISKDLQGLSDKSLKISLSDGDAVRTIDRVKVKIDELKRESPVKIKIEAESTNALVALSAVRAATKTAARDITGTKANFRPTADASPVVSALGNIRAAVAAAAKDIESHHPQFRADADASQVLATLKKVETAVQSTAGKIFATKPHLQATADVAPMLNALQRAQAAVAGVVKDIDGKKPTLHANADVAPVLSALSEVETAVKKVATTHTAKVKVDTDKDGMSRLAKLAVALASLSPLAIAAGGASTAAIASLGGAIATTVPIAVAGLGMLGGILATVKLGTQGVGTAMSALSEGDMKKFGEVLKSLSPNAQSFTLALKDMYLGLKQAQGGVQDQLFAGLGQSMHNLAAVEVPLLTRGMGGVAQELNLAAKEVMGYLSSGEGVARQTSMWISTRQVVGNLRPAFADVVAILSDLGEVGGKVLANVTGGIGTVTQRWRDWIAEARNSGKLEEIMRGGVEVFQKLGSIIGNTGSILASFYSAAKAAGSDFLTSLDRVTEGWARMLKSAEGQSALTTFFRESRAAVDALLPGLESVGRGVLDMIRNFGQTQGLSQFGAAVGEILNQVGQVIGPLGTLGGNVLKTLATSASLAAQVLGPVARVLLEVLNATGPVGPAIIAMVLAFNRLQGVNTWVTGLGTSLAGMATKVGVSEAASSKIAATFSRLGSAIPILGVAVVALGAAYEEFGSKADQSAQRVIQGSMTLQQAIAAEQGQVEKNTLWWNSAKEKQDAYAAAAARVTDEFHQQYNALSPMQKLQADVAMAQAQLNDAVAQFGAGSAQATQAGDALAAAQGRLKTAQDGAAQATKSHSEAMRDQINAAQQLLGSMLAVEDALKRAADAEKAANEAVKEHGASSDEAKAALNDYAQAADQAAQAVGQQVEAAAKAQGANDSAAQGTRAYGAALLTMAANAEGPAKNALLGYISKLSDSQLAALSAGAEASGFATKIMQLPDGRTVKIAVDPETGKIVSTQQLLDAMTKNPVMIQIGADTLPADQAFQRVLTAVQQGRATVTIDGQEMPALDALARVAQQAGLTNATVNIGGQTVNAMDALNGFIQSVKTGNPMVNIGGKDYDARQVFGALQSTIVGSKLDAALGLNPSSANATLAGFKTSASAQITAPMGINPASANGTAATVRATASAPATMPLNGNPAGVNGTIAGARASASATATMPIAGNPAGVNAASSQAHGAANAPATMPIGGRDAGAGATSAAVHNAANAPASMPVSARDNGVWSFIGSLPRVITAVYQLIMQKIGFAEGGILPMASGGIVAQTKAYDAGGADVPGKVWGGHRLTPMSGQRAAEVAPRTYRVIGDRQRDTEVFIPLDGSRSSLAFTAYAANAQGYALTPIRDRSGGQTMAMASGGLVTAEDGSKVPASFYSRTSTGNTGKIMAEDGSLVSAGFYSGSMPITFAMAPGGVIGTPMTQPSGASRWPLAAASGASRQSSSVTIDVSAIVTEIRALRAAVQQARPVNVDVINNNPVAERGSDATARSLRTLSVMGMFGGGL